MIPLGAIIGLSGEGYNTNPVNNFDRSRYWAVILRATQSSAGSASRVSQ